MRASGILLPVFSLPSPYGIGCFSEEARQFVDRLVEAGQRYWQILPLGMTLNGGSPYDALSGFAGNPLYIDPEELCAQGLLTEEELAAYAEQLHGTKPDRIDYIYLEEVRYPLLHQAYSRYQPDEEFDEFRRDNQEWLEDTALFWALQIHFRENDWRTWPEDIRFRREEALERWRREKEDDIHFFCWMQYEFFRQWHALREYAHSKGIQIVGDMPIYTSINGADNWIDPEIFQLDEELRPIDVSGCPPDIFSETGQMWGNPLYDWDGCADLPVDERPVYKWWLRRVIKTFELYDVVRIDHFRGLAGYYAIPADAENALTGEWRPGPKMELFNFLREKLGEVRFFAEDLGIITDDVRELLEETGYPGMRIIQFAFENDWNNPHMPINYPEHCVVYTGTHDNDTSRGWYASEAEWKQLFLYEYLRRNPVDGPELTPDTASQLMILLAMRSRANTCIIPMQDHLDLGSEARINTPGLREGNWAWRMSPGAFTPELAEKIRKITQDSGR